MDSGAISYLVNIRRHAEKGTHAHVKGGRGGEIPHAESEDSSSSRDECAARSRDELHDHAHDDGDGADEKDALAPEVVVQGRGGEGADEFANVDHGSHDGECRRRERVCTVLIAVAEMSYKHIYTHQPELIRYRGYTECRDAVEVDPIVAIQTRAQGCEATEEPDVGIPDPHDLSECFTRR